MEPDKRVFPILLKKRSETYDPFFSQERIFRYFTLFTHFGSYYNLRKGGTNPFMNFHNSLPFMPLGLKEPYVRYFGLTALFHPKRMLALVPRIAKSFDYILMHGGDASDRDHVGRYATHVATAGAFSLFRVEHPEEARHSQAQ
jgi:hypothetical protein